MPWEETDDFIRSGHRNADDFQPDSMRTIDIDAEKGIKAVIGKLKGEDTTTVQSYLFAKDKDWTVEKAKAWFEEHEKKKEYAWPGTIRLVDGVPNLVEGEAIHPCKTVHPEEWPHERVFLREQLSKAAPTLIGKPFNIDHGRLIPGSSVLVSYWNEAADAVRYLGVLPDSEMLAKLKEGEKKVSVEFRADNYEQLDGIAPVGITFEGLAMLENYEPGDPNTSIKLWEAIIKKEQTSALSLQAHTVEQRVTRLEEFSNWLQERINIIDTKLETLIRLAEGKPKTEPPTAPPLKPVLAEAVVSPGEPMVSVKDLEANLPSLQEEHSYTFGAQRRFQELHRLINEAKEASKSG